MYRLLIIHHPYTSVEYYHNINNAKQRMDELLTTKAYDNINSVYVIDDSTNQLITYYLKGCAKK